MYETWFRFTRRPFSTAPQLSDYFAASTIELAGRTIGRSIQRGTGPALLIGPPGTGKTVLCMKLHATFAARVPTANLCCAGLSDRRTLLQSLLFEFGRPYRQLDDGELRLSLVDYLTSRDSTQQGAMIILDDAHHLPSEAMDEIRMLSNLVRNGRWCAHLVLVGTTMLEESLHGPQMESFQQRIAARCYLEPFRREETVSYLRQCLTRANSHPEAIFTDAAIRRIHDHTKGVPRLINQLCDHALILAAAGHHRQLDAPGIDEAWGDLQQLPTPNWDAPTIPLGEVVEFGSLNANLDHELGLNGVARIDDLIVDERPVRSDESTALFDDPSLPMTADPTDEVTFPQIIFADDDLSLDEEFSPAISPQQGSSARSLIFHQGEFGSILSADRLDDPESQLSEIERRLQSLSLEMAQGPIARQVAAEPTVEPPAPVFCENPFLDDFETEELIIDRMGSLCHSFVSRQPQVATPESQEILRELPHLGGGAPDDVAAHNYERVTLGQTELEGSDSQSAERCELTENDSSITCEESGVDTLLTAADVFDYAASEAVEVDSSPAGTVVEASDDVSVSFGPIDGTIIEGAAASPVIVFPTRWSSSNPWQELDVPILADMPRPILSADEQNGNRVANPSVPIVTESPSTLSLSDAIPKRRFQNLFGNLKSR